MVHLSALPGSPGFGGDFEAVLEQAHWDAQALVNAGFDAIMIENYHDIPFYPDNVPAITVASLSRCLIALRASHPDLPMGINVLRNDALSALSIAHACKAQFIRVNVLTGASVTDQGLIQGRAAELIRTRHAWRAEVSIWADVGVKHASSLGGSDLAQLARDTAYRSYADALIVSGVATGAVASKADLTTIRHAVPDRPLLVGSGVTLDNGDPSAADGFIIGTSIKENAKISEKRARDLMHRVKQSDRS